MKVFIQVDGLVFVDVTDEQMTDIMKNTENATLKDTPKGLKVKDSGKNLYMLLYHLSYKYDVELI